MKAMVRTILGAGLLVAATAGLASAQGDDDLKAVKKAVGAKPATSRRVERIPPATPEPTVSRVTAQATATPEPVPPAPAAIDRDREQDRDRATPRPRGVEPTWFKVRIVERGPKASRVTVNLPLALVRALGDDFPVDVHCRRCGRIKLSEVLRELTTGQDIVEIDSDDATVRVWVE
jgi:hypothetical protein